MKVKVNYDKETTLVIGNYPDDTAYKSVPEPYIEVGEGEYHDNLGKTMCVVDGVYKEYVKPDDVLLEEAKKTKIFEVKSNRNNNLELPMTSTKAFEYGTENEVYFEFQTKATGYSVTDPESIIFEALSYQSIKYSCKIIEGESRRSGYVEITKEVAEDLRSHLRLRATASIQCANDLEEEINSINLEDFNSLEEAKDALNNINIEL